MPLCAVNTNSEANAFLRQARLSLPDSILLSRDKVGAPTMPLRGDRKGSPEKRGHQRRSGKGWEWVGTSRALSALLGDGWLGWVPEPQTFQCVCCAAVRDWLVSGAPATSERITVIPEVELQPPSPSLARFLSQPNLQRSEISVLPPTSDL